MFRRTAARHASIFGQGSAFARGAAGDWFGRQTTSETWRGSVASLVLCIAGIGVVNQFVRGNVMGRAEYKSDIVMPIQRRKVPLPDTYGFVDAGSEEGQTTPPPGRK
ncbi:hypothetical protein ABL78_3597 [Leptomonas seymouri]|uniref:Uncharacterized protein n=1 Tax=Leptomonas seymouri TaxID=5684 RepID=A0A0N1I7I8_LEPSE|nr:hypothetical protein ABL78_3597 [Leptomonas seymouri]|eukprot:KPI87314.1 hypothetical protein ABL78_3597 [Leptomonas seymouri]